MSFCMRGKNYSIKSAPSFLGSQIYENGNIEPSSSEKKPDSQKQATAPSYADLSAEVLTISMANDLRSQRVLVCYLPETSDPGIISCTLEKGGSKLIYTTDTRKASIPANAIIESIEFFGFNDFTTKDVFSIGLGQLNSDTFALPLITDADCSTANERAGGCRDFMFPNLDGTNNRNFVMYESIVNVDLSAPVTRGGLQIVIRYHMKIV